MKKTLPLLLILLALCQAAVVHADEELVGRVLSATVSRIRVELPGGATRNLEITPETRFFRERQPVPQSRLLPGSLVRIGPRDGAAQSITVLETPR